MLPAAIGSPKQDERRARRPCRWIFAPRGGGAQPSERGGPKAALAAAQLLIQLIGVPVLSERALDRGAAIPISRK